jgi:ribonuclease HI
MTYGLGMGRNNFFELMSLKLLIAFVIEKGCHSLIAYGDSMNVINWIRGTLFDNKPKQGYIKHIVSIRWNLYHCMVKN